MSTSLIDFAIARIVFVAKIGLAWKHYSPGIVFALVEVLAAIVPVDFPKEFLLLGCAAADDGFDLWS